MSSSVLVDIACSNYKLIKTKEYPDTFEEVMRLIFKESKSLFGKNVKYCGLCERFTCMECSKRNKFITHDNEHLATLPMCLICDANMSNIHALYLAEEELSQLYAERKEIDKRVREIKRNLPTFSLDSKSLQYPDMKACSPGATTPRDITSPIYL